MSVIGPRPGLWNQDILTAERDKYNANDVKPGLTGFSICMFSYQQMKSASTGGHLKLISVYV